MKINQQKFKEMLTRYLLTKLENPPFTNDDSILDFTVRELDNKYVVKFNKPDLDKFLKNNIEQDFGSSEFDSDTIDILALNFPGENTESWEEIHSLLPLNPEFVDNLPTRYFLDSKNKEYKLCCELQDQEDIENILSKSNTSFRGEIMDVKNKKMYVVSISSDKPIIEQKTTTGLRK